VKKGGLVPLFFDSQDERGPVSFFLRPLFFPPPPPRPQPAHGDVNHAPFSSSFLATIYGPRCRRAGSRQKRGTLSFFSFCFFFSLCFFSGRSAEKHDKGPGPQAEEFLFPFFLPSGEGERFKQQESLLFSSSSFFVFFFSLPFFFFFPFSGTGPVGL